MSVKENLLQKDDRASKTKIDVRELVFGFLEGKKPIPGNTEQARLDCAYLDIGVIDSLGIIEMVNYFEEIFQIRFSSSDMQSESFRSIGGLIELIERLMGGRDAS